MPLNLGESLPSREATIRCRTIKRAARKPIPPPKGQRTRARSPQLEPYTTLRTKTRPRVMSPFTSCMHLNALPPAQKRNLRAADGIPYFLRVSKRTSIGKGNFEQPGTPVTSH